MQRFRLNAALNIGLLSTVSVRELKVAILGSFSGLDPPRRNEPTSSVAAPQLRRYDFAIFNQRGRGMDRRDFLYSSAIAAAGAASTAVAATSPINNTIATTRGGDHIKIAQAGGPVAAPAALNKADLAKVLNGVSPMTNIGGAIRPVAAAPAGGDTIPEILQPIDTGASALLTPYLNAGLTLSPFEVEYLVNSFDDHIKNCLDLREKAQQLEVLAVTQRLELLMEQKSIEFLTRLADFSKEQDRHLSGSMFDPEIQGSSIKSGSSATKYFDDRRNVEEITLSARRDVANAKLSHLRQPGSGSNHIERFEYIKAAFEKEITEAYRRAHSIYHGMRVIYGYDKPLPPISDTGYLSKLALWGTDVFYELERRLMKTSTTTLAVSLRQSASADAFPGLLSDASYQAQRNAGTFKFSIPATFFDSSTAKLLKPRLRGLDVYAWNEVATKTLDYGRARITLPDQPMKSANGDTVWTHRATVIDAVVTYPTGGDFNVTPRREVHNANPIGEWEIQIDKRTLTDKETNKDDFYKNVVLVMRLSHEVA